MLLWMMMLGCRAQEAPPDVAYELVVHERGVTGLHQAVPTVVALHGLGDRPEAFVRALDGLPGPVRVVAVGAPEPWRDGRAWWTRRAVDGDWDALAVDVSASADALAPLLEQLDSDPTVCGRPVITGFSQGGMLSFAIAGRHPEHIAGAVPVAGTVLDGVARGTWATTRALHGDADAVVPFARTQDAVAALSAAGQDVSLQTFVGVAHRIPTEVRAAWYEALTALLPSCEEP